MGMTPDELKAKAVAVIREHFKVDRVTAEMMLATNGPTWRAEIIRRIEAGQGAEMFEERWKLKP